MVKVGNRPSVLQREDRVSGRLESPERVRRESGRRQESPERVNLEAGSVRSGASTRDDAASVRTAKSQKSIQRNRIMEKEDQVADLEEQITAVEIQHITARAAIEDHRDELIFKLDKLKEDFNQMKKTSKHYKSVRTKVADDELRSELSRLEEYQAAEKRILQSKLKSAIRKAENEKSQLEDIIEEEAEKKGRAISVASINSDERRVNTQQWINEVLDDVPVIPTRNVQK